MIQPMIFVAVIAVILSAVLAHRMAKRIVTPLNELNLDTPLENNETYPEISPLLTRIDVQHKKSSVRFGNFSERMMSCSRSPKA